MTNTSHIEKIRCPKCGCVQYAVVEHGIPWNTYIHYCKQCDFLIMESDWHKVEDAKAEAMA